MTTTEQPLPRLISVDDHVVEPPHVWQDHLPASARARGPRLVRRRGRMCFADRTWQLTEDDEGDWIDCWSYDGKLLPIEASFVAVSFAHGYEAGTGIRFEDLRPGCFDPRARLADMDENHTEASLCFPTFPRFCGQTFLDAQDRELARACVEAYNDWMIDEWCGGEATGRLIPNTLVPMWDPELAAAEVRRCAQKGSHAICFSEHPPALGLPSVFSQHWEPLWNACDDTETVVNMHVGSSSPSQSTSRDAPPLVALGLNHTTAERALVDWLCSGILERHRAIRVAFTEGQAGWIPYVLERLDRSYAQWGPRAGVGDRISQPPSAYVPGRVYACTFDERSGLAQRDAIGMGQLMFEVDYPHADSTFPSSAAVAQRMVADAGLDDGETLAFLRANAIECYRLGRYGLSA